ncbi:RagB/SusD family nutrient uptake outer membrane protein [Aliifodinibius sp. S!AR15-10]|uniref:RagB/SusD family nutrient uptake outer membrane protein n=1 Tax=Aliifodinibius sp. S!AR15-10 TaxID=2950437 RepID=UPI00285AE6C8|nr:RagB/SusD family nutrient uptake outer membrane protein [Aliifodinibius sp. S!AR15-10]MDR8389912.1 RagB/SusD family nutrient uptake outer membrane protein [Aliifodinibius sp. S!AR15-10]
MKKAIFLLCVVNLLMIACEGPIDIAPESEINEKNYYKTADDINNAVNAAYASLRSGGMFNSAFYRFAEMRSDNTYATWVSGSSFDLTSIYNFRLASSNSYLHDTWDDLYNSILRCNVVLDKIDGVELDANLKNRYKGEVRFLRALDYFFLVRFFGDVPMVATQISPTEAYEMGRTAKEQVYQQIIEDLEFAAESLPVSYSGANIGRATKGAALGILAKVYLTRQDYQNAKQKLEEVIGLGVYDLLTDYAHLWDLQHENSKESLFEVQYKKGGTGTGSPFANAFAPRFSGNTIVKVGGTGSVNAPTADMEDAYEDGDLRKDISMEPGYTDEEGNFVPWRYVKKYMDVPFQDGDSDNNWPVLRYADILLMYAEVLNEIEYQADGEAFNLLNRVRNRAGLPDKTSTNSNPDLRVENQQEFRLAVEQERRVELAFENHRWFDLVRTQRALEVMNSKREELGIPDQIQEHQLLFPIPLEVMEANPNFEQNSGY